jgi:hypothetical protein
MLISLLAAFPLVAPISEAEAERNRIFQVSVLSESMNEVTLNVKYYYSGNFGDNVFMSAVMARDGKAIGHFAYKPGKVQVGHGSTKVVLGVDQSAPEQFSSDQLLVSMYKGGGKEFIESLHSFPKTWSRPGNSLMPILKVAGIVPPFKGVGAGSPVSPPSGAVNRRRILANGNVEIQFPDGTKKLFYAGGFTIVRPDGTEQRASFHSAQPPTPPSAPPDDLHFSWLQFEVERLLDIIRFLVGNDETSVNNYLNQEGPSNSYYVKLSSRRKAIGYLLEE